MPDATFGFWNWVVFGTYLVGIFLIGALFARRQTSTGEFFTASKRMGWLVVSLSVVASLFSAISFIGHPARIYNQDATVLLAWPFCVILVTPIVMYVLLPFYRKLDVTTAYEYLEKRFSLNIRLLASALFIGKRLFWMALVALAPSLALSTFTGLPVELCVLIIGVIATVYTGLGGMSAVIWTDAIQFVVLMTGQVLMVFYIASRLDGGFGEIWQVGISEGNMLASMDFNFHQLTFWSMLICGVAFALSDIGADQVTVQRLMSTKDEKEARKSLLFNAIFKIPGSVIMIALGVSLLAFYKAYSHLMTLPEADSDKVVPFFVVTQLPAGLSGLVIAAIFAAAMSSFDSGLNCLVAALTVDWYERIIQPGQSDRKYLMLAKGLTFTLGLAVTIMAIVIYVAGIKSIIDASNKYLGMFGGGLLGIFMLGVLTRRAKALPTLIGAIVSVALVMSINVIQQHFVGEIFLHPYWYGLISCALTMLIGYVGSFFGTEVPYERIRDFTMARKKSS